MKKLKQKEWLEEGKVILAILVNVSAIGFGFALYDKRPACVAYATLAALMAIIIAKRMTRYDMD